MEFDKVASNNGTLLLRNDRSSTVDWVFSLRNIAFARTSNDARMRSIHVVCISPLSQVREGISRSQEMKLPDIDYADS